MLQFSHKHAAVRFVSVCIGLHIDKCDFWEEQPFSPLSANMDQIVDPKSECALFSEGEGWNLSLPVIHTHPPGRTRTDFAYQTKALPSVPVTSSPQSVLWRGSDLLPSPRVAKSDSQNPAGFVFLPSFSCEPHRARWHLLLLWRLFARFLPHLQRQLAEVLQRRSQTVMTSVKTDGLWGGFDLSLFETRSTTNLQLSALSEALWGNTVRNYRCDEWCFWCDEW